MRGTGLPYCKELIEGLGRHVGMMKGGVRDQRRRRKEPAGGSKVVMRCNGGKGGGGQLGKRIWGGTVCNIRIGRGKKKKGKSSKRGLNLLIPQPRGSGKKQKQHV